MADMIDAKEAKAILNCDDATLENHINGGQIRAQRVGGKLMLNKDDVQKVVGDDGTIVLTGDSDNLQIDLGKVVDDTSETVIQGGAGKAKTPAGKESITFGEELEVVNFDDKGTQDLGVDDTKKTSDLNFTDVNTAVMTSVDETQAGNTTGVGDTEAQAAAEGQPGPASSRRSVRSTRNQPVELEPVSVIWPIVMGVCLLVMLLGIVPYYFMSMWPTEQTESGFKRGETVRGVDDNAWTNMASTFAGFSVEPDKDRFQSLHGKQAEWTDIKGQGAWSDQQAEWRYAKYRGGLTAANEKRDSYVIADCKRDADGKVMLDENQIPVGFVAKTGKKEYRAVLKAIPNSDIKELVIDLGSETSTTRLPSMSAPALKPEASSATAAQ
jgi:hypothetical protein